MSNHLPNPDLQIFHRVFELSPEAIVVINRTGHIVQMNDRVYDWLGYKKSELVGKHLLTLPFFPLRSKEIVIKNFLKRIAGKQVADYTVEFKSKKNEIKMGSIRANLMKDENGRVSGEVVMISEVTEDYRRHDILQRREKILEAVGYSAKYFLKSDSASHDFQQVLKELGEATEVCRVLLVMNNLTHQRMEWVKKGITSINDTSAYPDFFDDKGVFKKWTEKLNKGEMIEAETSTLSPAQQKMLQQFEISSLLLVPIRVKKTWWAYLCFQQCKTVRIWSDEEKNSVDIAADIIGAAIEKNNLVLELRETSEYWKREKEKVAEEAKNTERFKLAVEAATDGVIIAKPSLEVVYVNPSWLKMTNYEGHELESMKLSTIITQLGNEKKSIWSKIETKKSVESDELVATRSDGTTFPVRLSMFPIVDKEDVVYFVALIEDITKRKEVEQMKSDFISIASHQLNTPLSAMKWFLELLLNGKAGQLNDKQLEFIQNISASNLRMLALVRSLLNISRIESGRIIVDPKKILLSDVLNDVLADLQPQIKLRKQKVQVEVKKIPKIPLDVKLIRQVYLNLLSNASKYSDVGDKIEVNIFQKGDEVITHIRDHGVGIPKKEQQNLFNRFYRGSNVMRLQTDGTGLGLYLVKIIVESSGGKIWYKSNEGKGTEFWLSLPVHGVKEQKGEVQLDETVQPI